MNQAQEASIAAASAAAAREAALTTACQYCGKLWVNIFQDGNQAGAIARHKYEASGRNGYTGVDVYVDGRLMRGPVFTGTRKVAEMVADELADAYEAGLRDAIIAYDNRR